MKSLLTALTALLILCAGCSDRTANTADTSKGGTETPSSSGTEPYVEVYDNGQPRVKGMMVDGERDGLWVAFYENGTRWSEENYRMGVLSGRTISFYPNGHLRYRGQYIDGEKAGLWQFYDEEGKLTQEITF